VLIHVYPTHLSLCTPLLSTTNHVPIIIFKLLDLGNNRAALKFIRIYYAYWWSTWYTVFSCIKGTVDKENLFGLWLEIAFVISIVLLRTNRRSLIIKFSLDHIRVTEIAEVFLKQLVIFFVFKRSCVQNQIMLVE